MLNQVITIETIEGNKTTVKVIRETAKAILVEGNCSEAWFPKKGLDDRNMIAPWVRFGIEHSFLFQAPYTEAA